jgi:hypothetical protein
MMRDRENPSENGEYTSPPRTPADGRSPGETLEDLLVMTLLEEIVKQEEEPTEEKISEIMGKIVPEVIPELASILVRHLIEDTPSRLSEWRAERLRFESVIRGVWGPAFDLLELVIFGYYEFGRDQVLEKLADAEVTRDAKFRALSELHARSVRTANEVLRLLERGLADGALARWRTLHEIAVVTSLLSRHGPDLSERYLIHGNVRAWHAMKAYQRHYEALGYEPVSSDEMQSAKREVRELRERFGDQFVYSDYGWAAGVVLSNLRRGPFFADLERHAELEKFRPIFGWASDSVHGGVKGLQSLGMPHYVGNVLYAAGSTSGLADPGQNVAISIGHLTVALMTQRATLDSLVRVQAISSLVAKCREAFFIAHEEVEKVTWENVERARREAEGRQSKGSEVGESRSPIEGNDC